MTTTISCTSSKDFVEKSATLLAQEITLAIERRGECIIGLSGGSTPRPVYAALGGMELPWEKVKLFLVDERYIAPDHAESNQRMIKESLLRSSQVPKENICFPNTALPLSQCVEEYARHLHLIIADHLPDLAVLGMGEDGHIASMFPPVDDRALGDTVLVIPTTTSTFAIHDRITVSLNLLAGSDRQIFLLQGAKKWSTWQSMLKSEEGDARWPAKRILKGGRATVIHG